MNHKLNVCQFFIIILFIWYLVTLPTTNFAQNQNYQWSLAPSAIDFASSSVPQYQTFPIPISGPAFSYTGSNATNCHNAMQDENGDLLFFIVDDKIYNKDGYYIEEINQVKGYSEIAIVPDPANCDRYYIISFRGKEPFYVLLDMSLPGYFNNFYGVMGQFVGMPSSGNSLAYMIPDFSTGEPKQSTGYVAVSTIRPDNSCFLFLSNGYGIFRCIIDETGIHFDNDYIAFWQATFNQGSMRGEMEIIQLPSGNYRLACPYIYEIFIYPAIQSGSGIFTCELDVFGNLIPGTENTLFMEAYFSDPSKSVHGLEFSPSGNILYVTHEPSFYNPNPIEYFDFNNPTTNLQSFVTPNAFDFKNSQIEIGSDGKLYFTTSNRMATLDNPDTPLLTNWTDNALSINYYLNDAGIATIPLGIDGLNSYILPDQIDGCDYSSSLNCGSCSVDLGKDKIVCTGEIITLDIGTSYVNIEWYKDFSLQTANTSSQLNVVNSGTYCVIATDINGCKAQDCITISDRNGVPSADVNTFSKSFSSDWDASSSDKSLDICYSAYEDPITDDIIITSFSNAYQSYSNIQLNRLNSSGNLTVGSNNTSLTTDNFLINYSNPYSHGTTNGILMTGSKKNSDEKFFIRIDDAAGNPLFSQVFPQGVRGEAILQDSGGDIVAVGKGATGIFVVALDGNTFNIKFIKEYQIGAVTAEAFAVVEANNLLDESFTPFSNTQYLITGEADGDVFVMGIDSDNGNLSFNSTLTFDLDINTSDRGKSMLFDGTNLVIGGFSSGVSSSLAVPFILKFNNIVSSTSLAYVTPDLIKLKLQDSESANIFSIVEDQNGDYVITGTGSNPVGDILSDAKTYVAKISSDLQTLYWLNTYIDSNYDLSVGVRVFNTKDNGFLVSGVSLDTPPNVNNYLNIDVNIIKTDNNGLIANCDCFQFSSGEILTDYANVNYEVTMDVMIFPTSFPLFYPFNANNIFIENSCSSSAIIERLYVDETATGANDGSSWNDAFNDLQDALAIGAGQEILVAQGIYKPTYGTSRSAFFDIPMDATILGGYPVGGGIRDPDFYPTILSGDVDNDGTLTGNSYHVVRFQNVTGAILDGITIQDGNADNAASFGRARGGGIFATGSEFELRHCNIIANKAIFGGGLFATLSNDVDINHCVITGNEAGNGSALYHSNATNMYIRNTRIQDNNSTIRCAIEINNSLYTYIENSVIANNVSTNANGIAFIATNRNQTCDIVNSTILGGTKNRNLITFQVGFGDQLDVNICNSIIAHQNPSFTKAFQDYNNGILNLYTENCYIQGVSSIGIGVGNLYSAVSGNLLLNPDYSVMACSPVVDAGNATCASALSTDIAGNGRTFGVVDIGAYEIQANCSAQIGETTEEVETTNAKISIGEVGEINLFPNPANEFIVVDAGGIVKEDIEVSLYNIQGKLLQTKKIYQGSINCMLNTRNLNNGNYIVRVNDGKETMTEKIVIAK